ncbi:hypothetical protein FAIPA1_240054 [Frankia sp. AiPs1]
MLVGATFNGWDTAAPWHTTRAIPHDFQPGEEGTAVHPPPFDSSTAGRPSTVLTGRLAW